MDEFKVIKVMNEATLELLKEKNKDYSINLKIQQLLNDDSYFFKIDELKAYEILKSVGVKQDKLEEVYKKLISPQIFYDLLYKGKLDVNDENLVIKYKAYR